MSIVIRWAVACLLTFLGACGEDPKVTGPAPAEENVEPRKIITDPDSMGGCWVYEFTIEPDTVGVPTSEEDPAIVEVELHFLEDRCAPGTTPDVDLDIDGPHVDIPTGLPVVDSLPPGWTLQQAEGGFACEPENPQNCWTWSLHGMADENGEARFHYQTSGEAGIDSISVLPFIVDWTAGPEAVLPILTLPCPDRPWFRQAELRDKLTSLWLRSNPHSTTAGIRPERERGAWVVEVGEDQYDLSESEGSGDRCTKIPQVNPPNPDPPQPGAVAYVHTHPLPANIWFDCGEIYIDGNPLRTKIIHTRPSGDHAHGDIETAKFYRDEYALDLKFYVIAIDFGVYEYYWNNQGVYKEDPFPGCIEAQNGN